MTENEQIILQSKKGLNAVNSNTLLETNIERNGKLIPTDNVTFGIDQYQQYIIESDASQKYRLMFTINPVCSNVLFNHLTEIVQNEGSLSPIRCLENPTQKINPNSNIYVKYKYPGSGSTISHGYSRHRMIEDTGFSHEYCGNYTYHCGMDIFNNHMFRNKEFTILNPLSKLRSSADIPQSSVFNTIRDYARDYDGEIVKECFNAVGTLKETHLYTGSDIRTFTESIKYNLQEKDGWLGFTNPTRLEVNNVSGHINAPLYKDVEFSLNKAINNKGACEFVDMYPDRTLFSFLPKVNKELHRNEYNWECCFTYPAANFDDSPLITLTLQDGTKVNGISGQFVDESGRILTDTAAISQYEGGDVILRTNFRHNFISGNSIRLFIVLNRKVETEPLVKEVKNPIIVKNIGLNGYDADYYFTINITDIYSELKALSKEKNVVKVSFFVQNVISGQPCKYYFRKFRRIPNFKGSNVYSDDSISQDLIKEYGKVDFSSTLNKLGFSNNIYGDRIAQLIVNDDVDLYGLYDNLGRDLTEIYLTIVKTNKGHELWYSDENLNNRGREIEFSHCFGDVTSGLDLPYYVDDNNVHKIHNLPKNSNDLTFSLFIDSPMPLESGLTISGDENNEFLGDLVELNTARLEETVLEKVYHRFNTMQRETDNNNYSVLYVDELKSDDVTNFECETSSFTGCYRANVAPEGYYYQPHYNLKIREFNDKIETGNDIVIEFDNLVFHGNPGQTFWAEGTTTTYNYFNVGDNIYIYDKVMNRQVVGKIRSIDSENRRKISFTCPMRINPLTKTNYIFLRRNPAIPVNAYMTNPIMGYYVWRTIKSYGSGFQSPEINDQTFTNNAHYIHKNINFFLRRQDPLGIYSLNYDCYVNIPDSMTELEVSGESKDVSRGEYFEIGENDIC